MKESKFFKNTAAEHHETHHGTDVPAMPSKDDHAHESTPHEDKKRSHRKEKNFPKERGETTMKIKTAPFMTAIALAVLFVFGLATDSQAKNAGFKFTDEKAANFKADKLEAFDFQPSTFQVTKFEAFSLNAFNFKVSNLKADYFEKAKFNAAAFEKFSLEGFDFKAIDSKVYTFKAGGFEKANFAVDGFAKAEFKV